MENNTPSIVFNSLFELIMSADTDGEWSKEQWLEYSKELQKYGVDTYNKLQILTNEFKELQDRKLELEETIKLLYDNLDKQRGAMLEGDIKNHRDACKKQYSNFWNDLEYESQEFFVTAHYLYERSKAQDTDFAPVVIEFCRIFENEMLQKIFTGFIRNQAMLGRILTYKEPVYDKAKKAVYSQNRKGHFFLSSMDMLKLLSHVNGTYNNDSYEGELQYYIKTKGFNTHKISDRSQFIKPGEDYVSKYRNEAAHPNYMKETSAEKCLEETEKLVQKFLDARK